MNNSTIVPYSYLPEKSIDNQFSNKDFLSILYASFGLICIILLRYYVITKLTKDMNILSTRSLFKNSEKTVGVRELNANEDNRNENKNDVCHI